MHPAWTAVLVVLPCLAITLLTSDNEFRLWWRTPKYFTSAHALIGLALLGAFVVGVMVPSFRRPGAAGRVGVAVTDAQANILGRAGRVFLALTMMGYGAWIAIALARGYGGTQIKAVLSLEPHALLDARAQFLKPVAGVTTLTQLGPVALVCLLLDRRATGRRHTVALGALIGVTLVRTVLNTERLAFLEMVVPAVVLTAAVLPRGVRETRRSWFWALLPLIAPVALIVVFGTFEYTRSWNDFYAQKGDVGFDEFVLRRLGGYYATSANNSAILLTYFAPFVVFPFFTLRSFWNFPLLSPLFDIKDVFGTDPKESWMILLHRYGNPEFNNDGGLLAAVADYGLWGALVWWWVVGLLIGMCYRSLRSGELHALVLYPILYVGLTDMARIFYWGNGRAFVTIVGAITVAWLLRRAGTEQIRS
jgi:hypothetical protein